MLRKLNITPSNLLVAAVAIGVGIFCVETLAAEDIGTRAAAVKDSLGGILTLMKAASYIAGFGLVLAGILKFKAHKDNPTQVPLSQPITLISVGAALVLLAGSVDTLTQTLLGTTAENYTAIE